jgi:predicted ArsR family transcriptional regulator
MNQKLQSLLTLLKTFSHPAAISELSELLNVFNRTIRRHLQQLIQLGLVQSQGKNKGGRTKKPISTIISLKMYQKTIRTNL